jgi:hypothetical protein
MMAIRASGAAVAAAAAAMAPCALDRSSRRSLFRFRAALLLLCAGVEMDSGIAAVCAGAGRRAGATFGMALAALEEPHWSALTPARPLRRWRLIDVEPGPSLTAAPLRIDERILHFLAGLNLLDPRLQPLLRPHEVPALMAAGHEQLADGWPRCGRSSGSGRFICAATTRKAPKTWRQRRRRCGTLFVVLPTASRPAVELEASPLWEREAALLPSALLVQCGKAGLPRR